MGRLKRTRSPGFSLVEVLAVLALAGAGALLIAQQQVMSARTNRKIASSIDIVDLSNSVRMILQADCSPNTLKPTPTGTMKTLGTTAWDPSVPNPMLVQLGNSVIAQDGQTISGSKLGMTLDNLKQTGTDPNGDAFYVGQIKMAYSLPNGENWIGGTAPSASITISLILDSKQSLVKCSVTDLVSNASGITRGKTVSETKSSTTFQSAQLYGVTCPVGTFLNGLAWNNFVSYQDACSSPITQDSAKNVYDQVNYDGLDVQIGVDTKYTYYVNAKPQIWSSDMIPTYNQPNNCQSAGPGGCSDTIFYCPEGTAVSEVGIGQSTLGGNKVHCRGFSSKSSSGAVLHSERAVSYSQVLPVNGNTVTSCPSGSVIVAIGLTSGYVNQFICAQIGSSSAPLY